MYIKVTVTAKAKEEKIIRKPNNRFDVFVREKAERNMANTRVIDLIAREFNIVRGKVRIVNGHQSPSKILSVDVE
jgi:uncharacterized protein YggU (UPF0235/DUF167 family)